MNRRLVIAVGLLALFAAARGQDNASVRLIVPFGPGTTAAPSQPEVVMRLREQGIEQLTMRSDEMLPFNKSELVKWAELVKRSGAQVD